MFIGLQYFNCNECDRKEAEQREKRNDPGVAVRVGITTPVQSE